MVDLAELEATSTIWEAAILGRKEKLLAYLRSDRPLTAMDREYLADYLEGKIKRRRGRPRDRGGALYLEQLALLVQQTKAKLRKEGKRYRIHNNAVDHALKYFSSLGYPVPREKLENYLRRSKRRKK